MKLRLMIATVLGALMLSESAFALSCAQPDLTKTLEEAKTSEKLYYILVGKFVSESVRAPVRPKGRRNDDGTVTIANSWDPKPPVITRSWFEGFSISPHAQNDVDLTQFPVDIETSCIGPWCSSPPSSNRDIIAFVEAHRDQAPSLKISPCAKWVFTSEVSKNVRTIREGLR